jgi:hypothetical protein
LITAGHQPNYLPWLGFFDKMRSCDVFIIEDNVQYEQQGFTNRNRIKTQVGPKWLTVPIMHVGKPLLINEVKISNGTEPDWAKQHWLSLLHNYRRAPFWTQYSKFFEETYKQKWVMLLDLNLYLIRGIMQILDIKTPIVTSSSLGISENKSKGANIQLCGEGAKNYLNIEQFNECGLKVIYQNFSFPIYRQLYGHFIPNLSVVDYLFCVGNQPW